jgi:hypothetical protein
MTMHDNKRMDLRTRYIDEKLSRVLLNKPRARRSHAQGNELSRFAPPKKTHLISTTTQPIMTVLRSFLKQLTRQIDLWLK